MHHPSPDPANSAASTAPERAADSTRSSHRSRSRSGWAYRSVLRIAAILAFAVVVLGATVRLADAGLACPDWPGCYGQPTVAAALASPTDERMQRWPGQPLDAARAQLEMLHRYAAGILGVLVIAIGVLARQRREARRIAPLLVGLVLLQVLLGMWTVTLRLEPLVVTAHLTGGLTLLALLWWLVLRDRAASPGIAAARRHARPRQQAPEHRAPPSDAALRLLAFVALGTLAVQLALGGWVAANHAALVCQGFPTCNGRWWPPLDMRAGFSPLSAGTGGDAVLSGAGRIAIHWTHRIGAAAALLVIGALVLFVTRAALPAPVRWSARVVGLLLLTQLALGIATVLSGAPLALAVAHNGTAALLLLALLTLIHRLTGRPITIGDRDAHRMELAGAERRLEQ